MPRKRKGGPKRRDDAAELEAWDTVFELGTDFFGDAADYTGLQERSRVWPPEDRDEAEKAWNEALQDAWRRLGARFLASRTPDPHRPTPWALEEFGEPQD